MSGTIDGTLQLPVGEGSIKLSQLAEVINKSMTEYGIHALRHTDKKGSTTKVAIDSEGEVYKGRVVVSGTNAEIFIKYKDEANPSALTQLRRLLKQTLGYNNPDN